MLAWLIIAFVTVAGTGTLAYFCYKLLNYFIRMKIEAEPEPEPLERQTKLKRTFRVQEGEDSDEERINIFREINSSDMRKAKPTTLTKSESKFPIRKDTSTLQKMKNAKFHWQTLFQVLLKLLTLFPQSKIS